MFTNCYIYNKVREVPENVFSVGVLRSHCTSSETLAFVFLMVLKGNTEIGFFGKTKGIKLVAVQARVSSAEKQGRDRAGLAAFPPKRISGDDQFRCGSFYKSLLKKRKRNYFFLGYDLSRATSVIKQILGSSRVGLSVLRIFCSFVTKPSGWFETLKSAGGEKQVDIQSSALGFAVPGSGLTMHCGRFP